MGRGFRRNERSRVEWIPYVDSYTKAKNEQTLMGYLIFPFTSEEDTEDMIQTIKLQKEEGESDKLLFSFKGEQYEIPF